jgi:uncharacterized membrane protein
MRRAPRTPAATQKKPWWKTVGSVIVAVILLGAFSFNAKLAFVLLFVVCLGALVLPSGAKRFYRSEQRLATSLVRSVAAGLAELRGQVRLDVPLVSPIAGAPCAGYVVVTERGSKDDDGRQSWSEISRETVCNDFRLADATGEIGVTGEGIALFDGKTPDDYESLGTDRRRGEVALRADAEIFVIGTVAEQAGKLVVRRGAQRDAVFGVEYAADVASHRAWAPLVRTAGAYASVLGLMGAGILALTAQQMTQFGLPGADNYEQMAAAGGIYRVFAWLYRTEGVPLPFMAAFGWLAVLLAALIATRWCLPRGMRQPVQSVLWAMLAIGMIAGAPPTLILVLADVNPVKVFLIWCTILVATFLFSLFEQRGLRVVTADMLKSTSSLAPGSAA